MKPIRHLRLWQRMMLFALCVTCVIALFEPMSAKVSIITNTQPRVVKKSSRPSGSSAGGSTSTLTSSRLEYVNCEGHETLITTDANGKTAVYINDGSAPSSPSVTRQDAYLVTLPADHTWEQVKIIVNGTTDNAASAPTVNHHVSVTMDGGSIGSIYLCSNTMPQGISLTITGGSVQNIFDEVNGGDLSSAAIDLHLDNMVYYGMTKMGMKHVKSFFVGSGVTFQYEEAVFTPDSIAAIKDKYQLQHYLYVYNHDIYASGAGVTVNAGTVLNGNSLIAPAGTTIANNGIIRLADCDGRTQFDGTITGNQPEVTPHVEEEVCIRKEDCENAGSYMMRCRVCGHESVPYERAALGHIAITDQAVAPTCEAEGLSEGSHCERCNEVLVMQSAVPSLGHSMQAWETATEASCTGTGSQKRSCSRCDYTETQGTNATGHTFGEWTITQEPTCKEKGMKKRECTICHEAVETETLSALGHRDYIRHQRVAATCTEAGMSAYWECGVCHQLLSEQYNELQSLDHIAIPALGHLYNQNIILSANANRIHAANCLEPALFHKVCKRCEAIAEDDDLTFTEGKALGHDYFIESIDALSEEYAEAGELTIACHRCEEKWPHFEFDVVGAKGKYVVGEPFTGYWFTCKIKDVLKAPTCLPGEGIYEVTVNYRGTIMEHTYRHFIPPVAERHNWSPEDGICHEKHYEYVKNDDGSVKTDRNGNMEYLLDADGNLIEDNKEYKAIACIAYEKEETLYDDKGQEVEDERGWTVTYYDYTIETYDDVLTAVDVAKNSSDASLLLFDDVNLEESDESYNRNIEFTGSQLTIDLNGHTWHGEYVDDYHGTQNYYYVETVYGFTVKNGTFNAIIRNASVGFTRGAMIFDNTTVNTNSVMWTTVLPLLVHNKSQLNVKDYFMFEDIDIDETSKAIFTDMTTFGGYGQVPGGIEKIAHYLPAGWKALTGDSDKMQYIYDQEGNRQTSFVLDGSIQTPHTYGYVDGGYLSNDEAGWSGPSHYRGCTLCHKPEDGKSIEETATAHTLDGNGKCTACGHNPNGYFYDSKYNLDWHCQLRYAYRGCQLCKDHNEDSSVEPFMDSVFTLDEDTYLPSDEQVMARGLSYERMVKPGVLTSLVLPAAVPASLIHGTLYILHEYSAEEGMVLLPAHKVSGMIDEDGCIVPGQPYIVKVEESDQPLISLVDVVDEEVFIDTNEDALTAELGQMYVSGIYESDFVVQNDQDYTYYLGGETAEGFTPVNQSTMGHRFECALGLPSVFETVDKTVFDPWESDNHEDNSTSTTPEDAYTFTLDESMILKVDWSVSSEENYDKLYIQICDVENGQENLLLNGASGVNTGSVRCFLAPGTYYLKCQYTKDSSTSNYDDKASISNASFLRLGEALALLPYVILHRTGSIVDGEEYTNDTEIANIDITYTRHFDNDHFNALYVPFSMQYSDWSQVADVYELRNIYAYDDNDDGDIDAWTLRILRLKEGSHTEANVPYLIRPKEIGDVELTIPSTTLVPANFTNDVWCASTRYIFDFYGTYSNFTLPANQYYFMSTTGGLQYNDVEATLRPQRWCMEVSDKRTGRTITPSSLEATSGARFRIVTDEETTDIEQIHNFEAEGQYFDLMGRRLSKPGKGLHIINNNKVIKF